MNEFPHCSLSSVASVSSPVLEGLWTHSRTRRGYRKKPIRMSKCLERRVRMSKSNIQSNPNPYFDTLTVDCFIVRTPYSSLPLEMKTPCEADGVHCYSRSFANNTNSVVRANCSLFARTRMSCFKSLTRYRIQSGLIHSVVQLLLCMLSPPSLG